MDFIKRLKKRLVFVTMSIISIMLFIILFLILFLTEYSFKDRINGQLRDIADNASNRYNSFNEINFSDSSEIYDDLSDKSEIYDDSSVGTSRNESHINNETENTFDKDADFPYRDDRKPFRKIPGFPVFLVSKTESGISVIEESNFDLSKMLDISETVEKAIQKGKKWGLLKNESLRYYICEEKDSFQNPPDSSRQDFPFKKAIFAPDIDTGGNLTIAFTDSSLESSYFYGLLKVSVLIWVLFFIIFFLISWKFADWATLPAEKAFLSQNQFIQDASHELKTPLTVIITSAELLNKGIGEEKRPGLISNILEMSEQMRGLVEGLLSLSRLENASSETFHFSEVSLSSLVQSSVLNFEVLFFEKGLSLESDIEENVCVFGDRNYLKELLDILLDNARKYSSPASVSVVSLKKKNSLALISVTSHGETISKQNLEKIFSRFYRLDSARKMNHSYGLGLSIARDICERHKGRIYAESSDNTNTFTAELPLIQD